MKALSLWQPWASLIAAGAKTVETRNWFVESYRSGPLAIHATKAKKPEGRDFMGYEQLVTEALGGVDFDDLPFGAIVAVAQLARIAPITEEGAEKLERENPREFAFGNYDLSEGQRVAWVLRDIDPLPEPIPCKGRQGLWNTTPEIRRLIAAQRTEAVMA